MCTFIPTAVDIVIKQAILIRIDRFFFSFDFSRCLLLDEEEIYDYCVSGLLCLRQYPTPLASPHPHLPLHSCDFQISISFMSEKCQNLLPLKSIASKGAEGEGGRETKIEAYFVELRNTTVSTWDGKEIYPTKKRKSFQETFCWILCGYKGDFPVSVEILIILLVEEKLFRGLCHRLSVRLPFLLRNWVDFVHK